MSFILEALKKAEAERQLGQVPNLHVQPVAALSAHRAPSRNGKKLLITAFALSIAASAVLAWIRPWESPAPAEQNTKPKENVPAPGITPPSAGMDARSVQANDDDPQIVAAAPSLAAPPAQVPQAQPAPVAKKPPASSAPPAHPPVKKPAAASPQTPTSTSAPKKQVVASPATAVAATPAALPAAAPVATASATQATSGASVPAPGVTGAVKTAARQAPPVQSGSGEIDPRVNAAFTPETSVPSQRELPEQIQRELPQLSIGGYIYSENPKERQLLVNRRLLHEGEEAAPGVVLEKMTPKTAVFNYRGYRYRIAY